MSLKNTSDEAFALYLEGQQLFSVIDRKDLDAALAKFRAATSLSPDFARAWGHIAYCLAQIVVGGHERDRTRAKQLLEEAEGHARTAISLDAGDYANHWDLAFVLLNLGRGEEAYRAYEHALALFDRQTDKLDRRNDLLVEMAEAYVYAGNSDRAFELLDRAVRVPDWYRWIRAWAHFNRREYKETIAEITAMRKKCFDAGYVPDIQLLLAAAYAYIGDNALAQEALGRLRKARADWDLASELARNPFASEKDRLHWEEGMRRAGFN